MTQRTKRTVQISRSRDRVEKYRNLNHSMDGFPVEEGDVIDPRSGIPIKHIHDETLEFWADYIQERLSFKEGDLAVTDPQERRDYEDELTAILAELERRRRKDDAD